MNRKQAKLMLKLADLLERVPDEKFNMASWKLVKRDPKTKSVCGSTACALGWACTLPEFKEAGVRLKPGSKFWKSPWGGTESPEVRDYGVANFEIGTSKLLGMTEEEADEMFTKNTQRSKEEVAKDLREFVRGKGFNVVSAIA